MKQRLETIKTRNDNLYSHLVQVLRRAVVERNQDAFQLFEYYSQQVKAGVQPSPVFTNVEPESLKEYVIAAKKLLNKLNTGTEQEPAEPGPTGFVANLTEEAKWFQKAGYGFGEELTFLIFKSVTKLSIQKQAKELRFWGKILCSGADYYVVETAAEGAEEGELPPDVEPRGTGVNRMTYWVTNDLSGPWKELPLITPQQMRAARRIRHIFSGSLDAEIVTNPHFPGKEAHYLKCQIVRATHCCWVVPRTMYTVNAENKKEVDPPAEDWKTPTLQFLTDLKNWVHQPQNILLNGRLTLLKPEPQDGVDVDEEKIMKELELKDPSEPRLKPISEDTIKDSPAWALRLLGDTSDYKAMTKGKDVVNYGYVALRNLIWRGWTTIFHNKQWTSLYVGDGHKCDQTWYYPGCPDSIAVERPDLPEQPEPNFPPEPEGAAKDAPPPEETS